MAMRSPVFRPRPRRRRSGVRSPPHPLGDWMDDPRTLRVFPQDAYSDQSGPHDYTRAVLREAAASVAASRVSEPLVPSTVSSTRTFQSRCLRITCPCGETVRVDEGSMPEQTIGETLQGMHEHEEALPEESLKFVARDHRLALHVSVIKGSMDLAYRYCRFPTQNEDLKVIQILGMRAFNACAASLKLALSGYGQVAASTSTGMALSSPCLRRDTATATQS